MAITSGITTINTIGRQDIQALLKAKVSELNAQPEFQWADDWNSFARDEDGSAAVRVAIANGSLEFDIWANLRNPATIGQHPVDTEQLWDFYCASRRKGVDELGRGTIIKISPPFSDALERFQRVVYISVLLPVNPEVFAEYNEHVKSRSMAPWDRYSKTWNEIGQLLDRAVTRVAYGLMTEKRAVLVMNEGTVARISSEAVPLTRQGDSHGPCKGGHYPQKSIAVLTGLAQFGVSRLVFRDEIASDGNVRRFIGALRSVIVFDPEAPVEDGSDGVLLLDDAWHDRVRRLSDLTNADPRVTRYRFCTYHGDSEVKGCGKCIAYCPAGALANSSPVKDGSYAPGVAAQTHRFHKGALQFDFGRCCDERGQLAELYDEWMCGRCLAICGGEGNRSRFAAKNYEAYVSGRTTEPYG